MTLRQLLFAALARALKGRSTVLPGAAPWPADRPFPLTDAACAALVRGHRVPWRGTPDESREHLPGRYGMINRYVYLRDPWAPWDTGARNPLVGGRTPAVAANPLVCIMAWRSYSRCRCMRPNKVYTRVTSY